MKLAKLDDLTRALRKRNTATVPVFNSIGFSNLPGFADATINPDVTFLAICGGTGLGKTALLELVNAALSCTNFSEEGVSPRLGAANVAVKITHPNGVFETQTSFDADGPRNVSPPYCGFADLKERTVGCQKFSLQSGLDELLEGVDPYDLDKDQLAILSNICRKAYEKIEVYEVDQVDGVTPYFKITENGRSYDSRTMATGEISAVFLAWILRYSPINSVVLIEEPEAHLPPAAHRAVFGLICQAALNRRLSFIVTTHSPEIASNFDSKNLVMLKTSAGKSTLVSTSDSKDRVLSKLGLSPNKSAILFTEDRLASLVLREILGHHDFYISVGIEIVQGAGAGGVRTALEGLPSGIKSLSFLGILDGDMERDSRDWRCSGELLYLPFARSMEIEFLDAIQRNQLKLGRKLNRSLDQIGAALEAALGREPHDGFYDVAGALGVTYEALGTAAFHVWLADRGGRRKASGFANRLATRLGVALPTPLN